MKLRPDSPSMANNIKAPIPCGRLLGLTPSLRTDHTSTHNIAMNHHAEHVSGSLRDLPKYAQCPNIGIRQAQECSIGAIPSFGGGYYGNKILNDGQEVTRPQGTTQE